MSNPDSPSDPSSDADSGDSPGTAVPRPTTDPSVVIIGAGPAGLTAAYQLVQGRRRRRRSSRPTRVVGGISRTAGRDGWRFDIGGHRFFTKVQPVEDLWHEILSDDEFLLRPRMSRIYYQGKYYDYPIKPFNALRTSASSRRRAACSPTSWVRVRPPKDQTMLEGYIAADYGWRLYNHFFKTYNEKLWGVPASAISADCAAQRIKGMSLWTPSGSRSGPSSFGQRDKGAADHQPDRGVPVPEVRPRA